MWKYPISPELTEPMIDLSRLRLDGALIPLLQAFIRADTRFFRAPGGTRLGRTIITGYRGASLPCVVATPEPPVKDAPAILYCHGGGFVFPTQSMMLRNACAFALGLGAVVALPEYRLLPDHPFPTPVEDAYSSLVWLVENAHRLGIDPSRIALYGDSAGGCLAAAAALMTRDRGGPPIRFQMLVYPVTDSSQSGESLHAYSEGLWPASANRQMWSLYLRDGDFGMPGYASPLQEKDLGDLPPAYIELAERDCLHSEGLAYAERLRSAGCDARCETVPGSYHGWDMEHRSPLTRRVLARRIEILAEVLKRQS